MKIAIAVLVVLLAFAGFVAMQADTYHVERSAQIKAPPALVFAQLDDFHAWSEWSPWDKLDPGLKREYGGPERAVGATYGWQGNKEVGQGKMTITELQPHSRVVYRIEFIEPFASVALSSFAIAPEGTGSKVTWSMDGDRNFMSKLFGLFMDMDTMIGKDFEKGLTQLAQVAEKQVAVVREERQAVTQ